MPPLGHIFCRVPYMSQMVQNFQPYGTIYAYWCYLPNVPHLPPKAHISPLTVPVSLSWHITVPYDYSAPRHIRAPTTHIRLPWRNLAFYNTYSPPLRPSTLPFMAHIRLLQQYPPSTAQICIPWHISASYDTYPPSTAYTLLLRYKPAFCDTYSRATTHNISASYEKPYSPFTVHIHIPRHIR